MSALKRVSDAWEDFRPDLDPKYSPNFYRFLTSRKRRLFAAYSTGYRHEDGSIWFGHIDPDSQTWFTGCQIMRIFCVGAGAEIFAHVGLAKHLTPIPDFWELYREKGRCAIDPEHKISFVGDEASRYAYQGDVRTCRNCGAKHRRVRHEEVVVSETWASLDAAERKD